MASAHIEYKTK